MGAARAHAHGLAGPGRHVGRALYQQAKADHAEIAAAVARFEPVLMVADPAQGREARAACEPAGVEVIELPIDDSWLRDSGPIFVLGPGGRRAGVDFAFNAWGEKFTPYDADVAVAGLLLSELGAERVPAPFVLEGGSIAVDGEGVLVTTEQCLLDPSRNPGLSREQIEQGLQRFLGVEQVVWLGRGLIEDRDTDGHVDNVCAFVAPGRVLLQTVAEQANPNWEHVQDNATRLREAGLEVVELALLPYLDTPGPAVVVPYMNYYLCNGAVIVPVSGAAQDAEALELIGSLYPGREVVDVPGTTLALGGGGVHCITQQVPATA